jgi:hypothetical protein
MHVCMAQTAQSFYPYTYIHTQQEEEKKGAQSTIHYVIIWTNVSRHMRLMGWAMQVVQCHYSHHRSMIDWSIYRSIVRSFIHWNKSLSYIIHYYLHIYVISSIMISNGSKRFLVSYVSINIYSSITWTIVWLLKGIRYEMTLYIEKMNHQFNRHELLCQVKIYCSLYSLCT